MVDDGSADDSDGKDYTDISDAAGSKRRGRSRSRKRVRRMKDRDHNDVESPQAHPLNVSCQNKEINMRQRGNVFIGHN